ncbi:MAG: MFS transporter [Magnetovibrionaceae bacterium]
MTTSTTDDSNPSFGQRPVSERLYSLATGDDEARYCKDISEAQCHEQPRSFVCQTAALACSKAGDALSDPKVVLPWLLGALGAPAFLIGFLMPIRESFALLPQILVGGVIRKFARRKGFWTLASLVEGATILGMGLVGLAGLTGPVAGWAVVGLLLVFSLARGVASIAAKDTLAKTVSKGRRGRVNGLSAALAGIIAGASGLALVLLPEASRPEWLLYGFLFGAGLLWFAGAALFWATPEEQGATDGGRGFKDLMAEQGRTLANDPELQKFLLARALMIATALTGPVYVALAQARSGGGLENLGWLMLASGLAGAISSTIWGAMSDRSSRSVMAFGAGFAGILGLLISSSALAEIPMADSPALYATAVFLLGIAHAGVRIGRKTHIVDLAGGDNKAAYVALSNTLIGFILLIAGTLVGLLLSFGLIPGLVVLSIASLAGALISLRLKNVQD